MRRHALASFATTSGAGKSRARFGRANAPRGARGDAKGSGAPRHRGRSNLGLLAIAVFALLAFAPAAHASKGVIDYFGGPGTLGGQFTSNPTTGPSGTAVNGSGAGGANAGDIYVVDRTSNRIERFNAAGDFISAWGKDVEAGGGTEYEICTVAANCKAAAVSTGLGGEMSTPQGIAVNQVTGDVYLTEQGNIRVQEFTATGGFVRAWGQDVVQTGKPENSVATAAKQTLTVDASAGAYKLSFQGASTGDLAFNATAATVQSALQGLSSIGAGNATVTGGPGAAGGGTPYVITFAGTLVNSPQPTIATSAGSTPLSGGAASATVITTTPGATGFEICAVAANCKTGVTGTTAGAFGNAFIGQPSIAPAGAPNAGNVLVADPVNQRMQEFSPSGAFERAFGSDVVAAGPSNAGTAFEVCKASAFDVCKSATNTQFTSALVRAVEDAAGNLYTLEPTGTFRVQKFTLPANVVTPQGVFAGALLTGTSSFSPTPDEESVTGLSATADNPSDLVVDPATGILYALKNVPANSGQPFTFQKEQRLLEVSPAGTLIATDLVGAGLYKLDALGYDPSDGELTLSARESQQILVLDDIPASVGDTLSASLDDPAVTGITTSGATVHGTVTAGQGIPMGTLYRFEYTNGSIWQQAPLGEAGNGSGAGDPDSCPAGDPPSCNVSASLSLEPGQDYKVRLRAFLPFSSPALSVTTPVAKFKTLGVAPSAETRSAWWSSPAETTPNLILTGAVNPKNEFTTFYFQYVPESKFLESGYDSAATAPLPPGDPAAKSFETVEVQQALYELDPSVTYHYRVVAVNPTATSFGADRTIAPPDPSERFFELVTKGGAEGLSVTAPDAVADYSDRVLFSAQAFEDPRAATGVKGGYVAERTASGWRVGANGAIPDPFHAFTVGAFGEYRASATLTKFFFETIGQVEQQSGRKVFQYGTVDGSLTAASPVLTPLTSEPGVSPSLEASANGRFLGVSGVSADLSHYAFTVENNAGLGGLTYVPGEPLIQGGNLYLVNGETLEVSLANRDSAGNQVGGACGGTLGGGFNRSRSRAISSDGSVVYFTARPGIPLSGPCNAGVKAEYPARIFKRENDATTTEISVSQCNRPALPEPPGPCKEIVGDDKYQGASGDGSTVFFSSPRQLASSDLDSAEDLYVYSSSPPAGQPTLSQVTAGEVTAGHPTVGSGAEFVAVVGVSADGSRVYFVAKAPLAAGASAGQNNLYVFERDEAHPTGRIGFVGSLAAADSELWGLVRKPAHILPAATMDDQGNQSYGDGRFLVFTSAAQLLPADSDSAVDLYRYADSSGQLLCISCAGNEAKNVRIRDTKASEPAASEEGHVATADVSALVFETAEALVPEDQNSVTDAYEWDEGELTLISRNTGNLGAAVPDSAAPAISLDGHDVYFATTARLVPAEVDPDLSGDIYDARVGGGFAAPKPEARVCIDGEVCRGATTSAPQIPGNQSASFNGPGNPAVEKPPKRVRCAKGKVRRHGRCVKAHHRRAQHKARGSK